MQLIMVGVPSKDVGLTALDRIDDAVAEGTITVDDAALVYRNEKGKVKIHQTRDATAKRGAFRGGAVGLLVGLIAAPFPADSHDSGQPARCLARGTRQGQR